MIMSKWVVELQKSFEDDVIQIFESVHVGSASFRESRTKIAFKKNERIQFDLRMFQMCTNVRFRNRKTEKPLSGFCEFMNQGVKS